MKLEKTKAGPSKAQNFLKFRVNRLKHDGLVFFHTLNFREVCAQKPILRSPQTERPLALREFDLSNQHQKVLFLPLSFTVGDWYRCLIFQLKVLGYNCMIPIVGTHGISFPSTLAERSVTDRNPVGSDDVLYHI